MPEVRRAVNLGLMVAVEIGYILYFKPGPSAQYFLLWTILGVVMTLVTLLQSGGSSEESEAAGREKSVVTQSIQLTLWKTCRDAGEQKRLCRLTLLGWLIFDIINASLYALFSIG